jgi:hypothetical protein
MCNAAIKLTSKALNLVSNAEELLKVKGFIALFIQTMEVRFYSARVHLNSTNRLRAGDIRSLP